MPEWMYDGGSWPVFVLVTVIMGGTAAFVSGRAIAQTWRPFWHLPIYMLALAVAVRFFHYALFEEVLLSLKNALVDFGIALAAAILGYRLYRAGQMARQYDWLYRRSGLFGWRKAQ